MFVGGGEHRGTNGTLSQKKREEVEGKRKRERKGKEKMEEGSGKQMGLKRGARASQQNC